LKEEILVLEINGNSLDDGPGIRTVVFMKGCPLSCIWCHNPESRKPWPEISYDKNKCIGCIACTEICFSEAISVNNRFYIDREKCTLCFDCVGICPSTALERVGHLMTVSEITEKVLRDKPFFDTSGGGVTLSGGEPLMNMEFTSSLLKNLKQNKLHILIETCGYFNYEKFKSAILPFVDIIYYDLKLFDENDHKKYCGISNSIIIENFIRLADSENAFYSIIPRIPLIPDITDSEKNLNELADFLQHKVKQVSLLHYNPLWLDKNDKLGIDFEISSGSKLKQWINPAAVKSFELIFVNKGIEVIHR
jgi:pyruvate formate lyase activating enzyme